MTTAFAHGLNAILESLGLDIGPDGEVFKVANTPGNVGVRADHVLLMGLRKVLETLEDAPEPVAGDLRGLFGPLKPELEADIAAVGAVLDATEHGVADEWQRIVRELRITSESERTELPAKELYRDEVIEWERKANMALEFARRHGQNDGSEHRLWVIDQMVRTLTGCGYRTWVEKAKAGKDGPHTYAWNEGAAP